MKNSKILPALVLCALALSTVRAQSQAPASDSAPAVQSAASSDELQKLRERIAKQEEEIKKLQESVEEQRSMLDDAVKASQAAQAAAATSNSNTSAANASTQGAPAKLVPAVNLEKVSANPNPQKPNTGTSMLPSPLAIQIGNTTFTPLGFVDATYFFRSATIGSGIGTNFGGVPYNNTASAHLSENNFSAQNSRIGMRVDSNLAGWKVLGYLEADFLFNNNSNGFQVTSNSAGLRLRNYFVDANNGKFEVLGGQDWSMLTPNRTGLSPLPADIFYTQNEDTNYQLGLVWTRAPQFRFIAHASDRFSIGLALENPQQYIGGAQGGSQIVIPSFLSGQSTFTSQFQNGSTSVAGVPNTTPVFIGKLAVDTNPGGNHDLHFEVGGAASEARDDIPAISTYTANKYVVTGTHSTGGFLGEVNTNWELFKGFHLIENLFWTDGLGRYIFGQVPDVAITPSGSLLPIHALSTVDGLEAQITKNTMLTFYYGGVYIQPTAVFDPTATGSTLAKPVYAGYGYTGSTQNRSVEEYTFGWIQTLWKNRNYGALALINQYSYLTKSPFTTTASAPGDPHDHIIYIDLRYTLP